MADKSSNLVRCARLDHMPGLTQYDSETADRICQMLIEGSSIVDICKSEGMPASSTVYKWLSEQPEFSERYTRAREMQMEAMAYEIIQIADDGSNDTYEDDEGHRKTDYDVVNRSKLRVDTRKWLMAKLAPKKYGDRSTVDLNSNTPKLSEEDLELAIAAKMKELGL